MIWDHSLVAKFLSIVVRRTESGTISNIDLFYTELWLHRTRRRLIIRHPKLKSFIFKPSQVLLLINYWLRISVATFRYHFVSKYLKSQKYLSRSWTAQEGTFELMFSFINSHCWAKPSFSMILGLIFADYPSEDYDISSSVRQIWIEEHQKWDLLFHFDLLA